MEPNIWEHQTGTMVRFQPGQKPRGFGLLRLTTSFYLPGLVALAVPNPEQGLGSCSNMDRSQVTQKHC